MCEHENAQYVAETAKDYYACRDCGVKVDAEIYKALKDIPSKKTPPSEQQNIRQSHIQMETWENSPMVET